MSNKQTPDTPETAEASGELFTIEELKERKKTGAPLYAGTCTANGWQSGKMVTEDEYDAAVVTFSGSPIGKV